MLRWSNCNQYKTPRYNYHAEGSELRGNVSANLTCNST